jgi:chromosome segregation ATPase
MAKLIQILAASVGTGLVLGASIRMGEAIGSSGRKRDSRRQSVSPEIQATLGDLVARVDRQQSDVEAIRHQVQNATRAMDAAARSAEELRHELHAQLSEDLDQRLAAIEEKLFLSMKTANRETANAMVASIETRVAPRISRLESDVTSQSAALAELRDCSLQSERSIQRLLTVLERVASPKARQEDSEPKLAVVTNRGAEESADFANARRPAPFR